jgi:hypothetical protein
MGEPELHKSKIDTIGAFPARDKWGLYVLSAYFCR